jgi:hypothetical protein
VNSQAHMRSQGAAALERRDLQTAIEKYAAAAEADPGACAPCRPARSGRRPRTEPERRRRAEASARA